jgi:hypothetical protein
LLRVLAWPMRAISSRKLAPAVAVKMLPGMAQVVEVDLRLVPRPGTLFV